MKPLVCELCGSNDVVKEGEYFVCQHCGTKYSVEAARQMMFGGTVKVDNSDQLQNYIILAKRHFDAGDYETASGYVTRALELSPNSSEVLELQMRLLKEQSIMGYISGAKLEGEYYNSNSNSLREITNNTHIWDLLDEDERSSTVDRAFATFKEGLDRRFQRYLEAKPNSIITFHPKKEELDGLINTVLPYWQKMGVSEEAVSETKEHIAQRVYDCLYDFSTRFKYGNLRESETKNEFAKNCAILDWILSLTQSNSLKIDVNKLIIKHVQLFPEEFSDHDSGYNPISNEDWNYLVSMINDAASRIKELDPNYKPPNIPFLSPSERDKLKRFRRRWLPF